MLILLHYKLYFRIVSCLVTSLCLLILMETSFSFLIQIDHLVSLWCVRRSRNPDSTEREISADLCCNGLRISSNWEGDLCCNGLRVSSVDHCRFVFKGRGKFSIRLQASPEDWDDANTTLLQWPWYCSGVVLELFQFLVLSGL